MKKKILKSIGAIILLITIIITAYNLFIGIVSGEQEITTRIPSQAYANSDVNMSISASKGSEELDTKTKIKLLNASGKKVKEVKVKNDGNTLIMSVPKVESGNYTIRAKVSSKKGIDVIEKDIYIYDYGTENATITFDKGIYKPGDDVKYRVLLTKKDTDEPILQDVNVSIYDGNGNKVYNEDVKTSDYGIVSDSFALANEVNSGLYKLVVKVNNIETTKEFIVNPYVTPKYEVKIKCDKDSYLVGDTAKITFNSGYFFGESAKNTNLKVFINNTKVVEDLKTDDNGVATYEYEIKSAKKYNIKVEAVDSSNYYVEATSSFVAGTDKFEVKLLPEYGYLAGGVKNNIYVLTSKADGTPIKTYITVTSDENYTKQIVTDENGIGKFAIDINPGSKTAQVFNLEIRDLDGNIIHKKNSFSIVEGNTLLTTDKVKYTQGDDIEVKLSNLSTTDKNIYFVKGNRIIKMMTTDLSSAKVNLGDVYGLIDIYITKGSSNNSRYNNKNALIAKTIFIKPKKELTIGITTNKGEYRPGEEINISFDAKDENNSGVDAALLVSMLDNSILSLAENDLSIDNIKMALKDIKFSSELDAATFYSCIIDDNSEQTMTALLLKQNKNGSLDVSEKSFVNYEQEDKAMLIAIISGFVFLVVLFTWLFIVSKKFRRIIKHFINLVIFEACLISLADSLLYEFFWRLDTDFIMIGSFIMGIAIYILILSKYSKELFKTSFLLNIALLLSVLIDEYFYYMDIPIVGIIVVIISVIFLASVIIWKIGKSKKPIIKEITSKIIKGILYCAKFTIVYLLSLWLASQISHKLHIYDVEIPIMIALVYLIEGLTNYLIKKKFKIELSVTISEGKGENEPVFVKATIGVVVALIAIASLWMYGYIYTASHDSISEAGAPDNYVYEDATLSPQDSRNYITYNDSTGSASASSSIFDKIDSYSKSNFATNVKSDESIVTNKEETVVSKDENVRNIFLESMCFIPELIISQGSGSTDLTLSDNITTWTIQVVGNTKDGRIGYGSIDNVKVFKEFFVDFELPKNMVEKDNISIPVTVYNYTDSPISTTIKVQEDNWFKIDNNNINIRVEADSTNMVYVPISIIKFGENKFRVEVSNNTSTDIVEKGCTVSPRGYKIEKVVSTGSLSEDIEEDLLVLDDIVENTAKAKIKIYPSTISQVIEGMDKIFRMPTGCFEQVSSSLYPNIVALKYMEDNNIIDEELKAKALSYISSGYQKLLTYEVRGESGGYSLYGKSPAETVLTAYGLMELTDLKQVYKVDDGALDRMNEYLYGKQKANGSFTITGYHVGSAENREELSLNAYITWALSESNPKDGRLNKSVEYLKDHLDDINDNYTLALVANVLANTNDKSLNSILKTLVSKSNVDGKNAYITSNITDYYGSRFDVQTIQTVALTSMALSKGKSNVDTNKMLANYLTSKMDNNGTWYSTQATTLVLKALNQYRENNKIENQTITVKVNSEEQRSEIKNNSLDYYEFTFEKLSKENKLKIDVEKGNAYYEVVEEYYVPYEKVNTKENKIEVSLQYNNNLKVNDILTSNIQMINRSDNEILNGMVTISIPQGFTIIEESLMKLENDGLIEKYEMTYTSINIYLRDFEVNNIVNLDVQFRASYPVDVTGMSIRAYDYYNPSIEGMTMPVQIKVTQ